jgi:hypothetical protein
MRPNFFSCLFQCSFQFQGLSARNVLVDDNMVCKVSGFGQSQRLHNTTHCNYATNRSSASNKFNVKQLFLLSAYTDCFISPNITLVNHSKRVIHSTTPSDLPETPSLTNLLHRSSVSFRHSALGPPGKFDQKNFLGALLQTRSY